MPKKVKDNLGQLLQIKNATNDSADLYFYGDIVSSWWGAWDDTDQYPEAVKNFLDGAKGKNLNIYINSGGGSVFAGMAIYNMLKRHEGHKTVRVDGVAASIASIIALAGDKIIIPANAYFMIHKAWNYAVGNADEFRKMADILDSIDQGILNAYEQHLAQGVNIETIKELIKDETWMTGDEAAKHFNIEVTEPIRAVAYAGELKFAKVPNNIKVEAVADMDTNSCVCQSCNHGDNCQSSGAKCCICGNCPNANTCTKPGAEGCQCKDCTLATNNACQPGHEKCLCDTCTNMDTCGRGQMDGMSMGNKSKLPAKNQRVKERTNESAFLVQKAQQKINLLRLKGAKKDD